MTAPDDPLILDVRADLDRVDRAMTQIVADPALSDEFIRDPNGVLSRLGMHARTSRDIHDRSNQLFYATLTNSELVTYVAEHFRSFEPPAYDSNQIEGLRQGEIRHSTSLDDAALDHCLSDPEFIQRMLELSLHDLNNRGLLQSRHSEQEIDNYIARAVEAIAERRPIREMPVLEERDRQYGIGKRQGVEVSIFVSAVLPVDVTIPVSIIATAQGNSAAMEANRADMDAAFRLDPEAVRMTATVGALTRLAGELLQHAYSFER
jgi:hypothetical protein